MYPNLNVAIEISEFKNIGSDPDANIVFWSRSPCNPWIQIYLTIQKLSCCNVGSRYHAGIQLPSQFVKLAG